MPSGIAHTFNSALCNYLDILRQRAYNQRYDLSFATSPNSLTQADKDYYYSVYNELWSMGGRVEAYTLLRLVFGQLRLEQLLSLLNENRLMTEAQAKRKGQGANE